MLHYTLLATFCWMLCEGVHLYKRFVVVFDAELPMTRVIVFAQGAPVIAVAVTAGLGTDNYGNDEGICFLEGGAIWAFAGPALAVAFANLVCFGFVFRAVWSVLSADDRPKGVRALKVRRGPALLPLHNCRARVCGAASNTRGGFRAALARTCPSRLAAQEPASELAPPPCSRCDMRAQETAVHARAGEAV